MGPVWELKKLIKYVGVLVFSKFYMIVGGDATGILSPLVTPVLEAHSGGEC